ncbi:MAG: ATP-binding protein [Kofleriaceae bacterium]
MTAYLDELFAYIGFGETDVRRLRGLHDVLEPHFPAIAARFYDAVWANPGAAAVLTGPEQVERLRRSLIDWMSTGLLGPHDERFYEKRSRIGRRHIAVGLAHHYMFAGMNVVRLAYHEHVARLCPDDVLGTTAAVDKLLDVELAIVARHYQLDSEDRLVERERYLQRDRLLAMQTMTAGLAHEVRNPLNAAKLQIALLERRLRRAGIDPRMIEPAELAQSEIERLTLLLNDFLAFARPPELHTQDHDVALLVRHIVAVESETANARDVSLVLLASPETLLASVDAPKLGQVLLNLVRNAIEAAPRGGHVTVELIAEPGGVLVRIEDDGPGIPPEVEARIYEPFFSTKESGTGLGMSIVHSLVSLHRGRIELATGPHGTRFEIRLPYRQ